MFLKVVLISVLSIFRFTFGTFEKNKINTWPPRVRVSDNVWFGKTFLTKQSTIITNGVSDLLPL